MNKKFLLRSALIACALLSTKAQAIFAVSPAIYETPVVVDTVTQIDVSTWKYEFTLTNMAMIEESSFGSRFGWLANLTDYLVPYFNDASISISQVPAGWAWRIDTEDRFNLGHGAQTLHWYSTSFSNDIAGGRYDYQWVPGPKSQDNICSTDSTNPVCFVPVNLVYQRVQTVSGATLGGFSFLSGFSPVKAPFLGGFSGGKWMQGDPALPGSPDTQSAGLTQPVNVSAVPEPAALVLMAAGLMLLWVKGHRTRKFGEVGLVRIRTYAKETYYCGILNICRTI